MENTQCHYTPGPWNTLRYGRDGSMAIFVPGRRVALCTASEICGQDSKSAAANAALISAAPDLLLILKIIADELGVSDDYPRPYSSDSYIPEKFHGQIRAAIAKAEGRA